MKTSSLNQSDFQSNCGISLSMLAEESTLTVSDILLNKPTGKRTYLHTPAQIANEIRVDENGVLWWVKRKRGGRLSKPITNINKDGYIWFWWDKGYTGHVIAWCLYYREWPPVEYDIDHINGIRTDNRKENLRLATRSQNMLNSHKTQATNTSGYPGVSYVSSRKKWRAYIKIGYKQIFGGYFDTLEEAILARTKLELKHEHCTN